MSPCPLDEAVGLAAADLLARNLPRPDALLFLSTGVGMLPARLTDMMRVPLGKVKGVPEVWRDTLLYAGKLGATPIWMIENAPGAPEHGAHEPHGEPAWVRGFPCWLAAAAGAPVCLYSVAGLALPREAKKPIKPGSLALLSDHINLSGRTPLVGLGESKLGPLFPDQSRLHLESLRKEALKFGKKLGVPVVEAIGACTIGPAIETPAERAFWARTGADVAAQTMSTPLLACAHSGLALLAVVCVTDAGEGLADVGGIVMRAEEIAPALEDLIVALAPALQRAANELGIEE